MRVLDSLALVLLLTTGPVAAAAAAADREPTTVALFSDLQERGPSTPEELAARAASASPDVAAADAALNDWKLCVTDSVGHWAELGQGPGTLVDGAYGRCGDQVRLYRDRLLKVSQNGRLLLDAQFARSMVRGLEESWRQRLIAMALDQDLARRAKAPTAVPSLPKR